MHINHPINIKYWLPKICEYWKTGYSQVHKLFCETMTSRKLEDDTQDTPNKKLCTEEEKGIATKVKRRNVALLLAYSGVNYHGMQINTGFKTVEGDLLKALHESNLIPEAAVLTPQKIGFQRAARTDKSVSAARQVVSFHIADNYCIENINKYLPEDVKVFSIKRVTKGFNSKNFCNARTYSYTLPTFALAPQFHEEFSPDYRIDQETIDKVNEILNSYVGTNVYHNFTTKKNHDDPSARRYVMSFTSGTPFVESGLEFVTLTVKGQSFMFHQIRKMVGYLVALLKGHVPENVKEKVWSAEKWAVPLAPGLGLVLEDVHYDMYNRKFGKDGLHEALLWDDVGEELKNFKNMHILPNIVKTEIEEKVMFNWTLKLKDHSYNPEYYSKDTLNSENNSREDTLNSKVEKN